MPEGGVTFADPSRAWFDTFVIVSVTKSLDRAPSPYDAPATRGPGATVAVNSLSAANTADGTASAMMSAAVARSATTRDPAGRDKRATENDDIFPSGPR